MSLHFSFISSRHGMHIKPATTQSRKTGNEGGSSKCEDGRRNVLHEIKPLTIRILYIPANPMFLFQCLIHCLRCLPTITTTSGQSFVFAGGLAGSRVELPVRAFVHVIYTAIKTDPQDIPTLSISTIKRYVRLFISRGKTSQFA